MRHKPRLTLPDAYRMADAARGAAARKNLEGTIAIVDDGGALLYLERPDRQSPNSVDVATMKARTAAFRERPSADLQERVRKEPGWMMFPNGLPMPGGIPLMFKGECVGGIGVSGIALDDEPTAQAGADALGDEIS
ncbi:MAG: glc operon protein GlcG [Alphaproteobacteria bacterium]|jgi:glc operon protein GlcG|nr:glc operon protein GlcG [Alphaproteobacteria bacterium]MEA3026737.1 glc operon protein GlcG [Alphaproteobacteria bacterium]